QWYVAGVDPRSEAAQLLRAGDRILAVDGDTRVERIGPWLRLRTIPAGQPYTIRVARESGRQEEFTLSPRLGSGTDTALLGSLASLVYFAFALFVGLLKPGHRAAQLASLSAFCQALYIINPHLIGLDEQGFLLGWGQYVYYAAYFFHPINLALVFHFFYRFPPTVPKGRFWSRLVVALYALAAVIAVGNHWREFATVQDVETASVIFEQHARLFSDLFLIENYFRHLVFILIFAVVVRNYRAVSEPGERRRLKLVTCAALAYALPPLVNMTFARYFERFGPPPASLEPLYHAVVWAGRATTLLFPVVVAYAIVKHRVFDLNFVVRRGLQYLLARNALRVVLALPVAGLAWSVLSDPERTLGEIIFRSSVYFYLLAAATAAFSLKYRRRLVAWLDHKFFREAYDRERVLLSLAHRVQTCDSFEETARLVSRQVEAALHPKSLHIFYRAEDQRELTLGYTSSGGGGVASPPGASRIADDSLLLQALVGEGSTARDYASLRGLPREERAWLEGLRVELLVPLLSADHDLAGLFLLGERKSEQPYAPTDRRLLEGIAGQLTVVYENMRLRERMSREQRIKREVLARLDGGSLNLLRECPACGACYDSDVEVCAEDGRELRLTLPVGRLLEGKYRLERLVGRGGMGAVYEATDVRLSRRVAVKIMTGSLFGDQHALSRFRREARTAARLAHPNIISIHDYGAVEAGGAYLVMELARGRTLREELERAGRFTPRACADLLEQILDGVEAAHAAGVVHRDLKPENILLIEEGSGPARAKILDFGIAKTRIFEAAGSAAHTAPGVILGTLGYMSPEQLAGEEVDEGTDVYSLGVIAYEALTGRRPYRGRTPLELLRSMQTDLLDLPGDDDTPEVRELLAALKKCLAPQASARYATAGEMRRGVVPALRRATDAATASAGQPVLP
ncbi:MAG: protein kinase domain-containing protein, partial [Pyrinomonadaceae bacterium]